MSFSTDGRTVTTSWGANSTLSRTAALNAVRRTSATEVEVAYSWLLSAAVSEVWGFEATVAPVDSGRDFEDWLGGEAWESIMGTTLPLDDTLSATFTLPAVGMVLLAQREPRYEDAGALAIGEVHRFALYNDGVEWHLWQWFEAPGAGASAVDTGVIRQEDGKWVLDTDPDAEAGGYLTYASGKIEIDTSLASGLAVRKAPQHILSY